ncbi:uncharacterized protein LOC126776168 [Nymphalis io]|uniref:uncharacterized protein LOC126776168 n=1 Tax=Inachis io TaxID=171585 RepID=UPI00216754AA|nr:uncharacterized protein LOC126776168 [Nymphalis io]
MNNDEDQLKTLPNIDVNNPDFYDIVQQEIDYDLARMKKNVAIVTNLRMAAAEIEVETAALYHAELWYDIENLKAVTGESMKST